jgi:hypothetical protein
MAGELLPKYGNIPILIIPAMKMILYAFRMIMEDKVF